MTAFMTPTRFALVWAAAILAYVEPGACIRSSPSAAASNPVATPGPSPTDEPAAAKSPPTPPPSAAPSASPAGAASPSPRPTPGPLDADVGVDIPLQEGWATIDEKADESQRAWMEGEIRLTDRLIITTSSVRRFALDLTRLRLNWDKRILLRLDGFNFELTRKRWPVIHFIRTPAGAWEVGDK
jgi:hypothetical protein